MGKLIPNEPLIYERANGVVFARYQNKPEIPRCTVVPVVWKRRWDKGRIFYCSIGHRLEDLRVPDVTEIVKRGISWAARKLDV